MGSQGTCMTLEHATAGDHWPRAPFGLTGHRAMLRATAEDRPLFAGSAS
jgi:hypothetical protein